MIIPNDIQNVYKNSICLFTSKDIEFALDKMAVSIYNRLHDKNPILICVMMGGLVLMGNLLPRLNFPLEIDYVHVTRYYEGNIGKLIKWKVRPKFNVVNRTILIIDDILDGGITLSTVINEIKKMKAEKIYSAVLINKKNKRISNGLKNADFVGLQINNRFVFGYGMDYKKYFRNAPGIFTIHTNK